MVIINVKEALKPKEKPKVVIIGKFEPKIVVMPQENHKIPQDLVELAAPLSTNEPEDKKSLLLADLTAQEREIHKERNKFSNDYHALEAKNAPIADFKANYDRIEALTEQLQALYDQKQHIEKFGDLPKAKEEYNAADSQNIFELKEKRRSLNNIKSKENNKLKLISKYPEGSPKRQEILLKIAKLEAEQDYITKKIKSINEFES